MLGVPKFSRICKNLLQGGHVMNWKILALCALGCAFCTVILLFVCYLLVKVWYMARDIEKTLATVEQIRNTLEREPVRFGRGEIAEDIDIFYYEGRPAEIMRNERNERR